uniref:Homeobox domain-containing protein n=1 Tax=Panagrellus redivivus TaxID=6233 RepID=A0A7E4V4F3_PANRE
MDPIAKAFLINSYIASLMNPIGFLMNPVMFGNPMMSSCFTPSNDKTQRTQNLPLQAQAPAKLPVDSTPIAALPTAVSTSPTQTPQSTPAPKPQRRFGQEITQILWDWFNEHITYPYPDEEAVRMLTIQTGITGKQLRTWFLNRRRDYEKKHGFTKWNKMPAPPCSGKKRSNVDASGGNVEPAQKRARY